MIIGLGIDLVDMAGFKDRLNDDLVVDLFLPGEIEYCRTQAHPWENFAGRFAAKEAAFKALGSGLEQGLRFNQVEVLRADSGAVSLVFHGPAAEVATNKGVLKTFVSISHSRSNAVAVVIAEGEKK